MTPRRDDIEADRRERRRPGRHFEHGEGTVHGQPAVVDRADGRTGHGDSQELVNDGIAALARVWTTPEAVVSDIHGRESGEFVFGQPGRGVEGAAVGVDDRCCCDRTGYRSRAAAPTVFPSSRTRRTAPALKSSVNWRRARRFGVSAIGLDIVFPSGKISTASDQAHG